jgi:hypothetical protein
VDNFLEDIDRIHEIIVKYSPTHEILVMGDLNKDHYNRDSRKEREQ